MGCTEKAGPRLSKSFVLEDHKSPSQSVSDPLGRHLPFDPEARCSRQRNGLASDFTFPMAGFTLHPTASSQKIMAPPPLVHALS